MKMKKQYYGYVYCNGGSTYTRTPHIGTNKRRLGQAMRQLALANTYSGSTSRWSVYDDQEACNPVLSGVVRNN